MPMVQWLVPPAWLWVAGCLVAWLSAGCLMAVGCLTAAVFAFLEAGCHLGTESRAVNECYFHSHYNNLTSHLA